LLWPQENVSPNETIHELKAITIDPDDHTYPIETHSVTIGLYSAIELAEAEMARLIVADTNPAGNEGDAHSERIHHFVLQSRPLNAAHHCLDDGEKRIYDDQGIFHGVSLAVNIPFQGRKSEECAYRKGDLVEVSDSDGLIKLGIVSLLPVSPEIARRLPSGAADQTDNVYCIVFCRPTYHHAHLPECDLFRPRFRVTNHARSRLVKEYRILLRLNAGNNAEGQSSMGEP